jgi:hypothetical protein
MLTTSGFRNPDGSTDWKAFYAARIAIGEVCSSCESSKEMPYPPTGAPTTCSACERLSKESGEVAHHAAIRCPACGVIAQADDTVPKKAKIDAVKNSSSARIVCRGCRHEYYVEIYVSYRFYSPARVAKREEAAA